MEVDIETSDFNSATDPKSTFCFRSPVVDLAEKEGIDTLLLPLSWWDMFPHQLAHSNQDAWARGLQVLSFNIFHIK